MGRGRPWSLSRLHIDTLPERDVAGDICCGGFWCLIQPGRILVDLAVHLDVVIARYSLPGAFGSCTRITEKLAIQGRGRNIMVAFDNNRIIRLRKHFTIPYCFHMHSGSASDLKHGPVYAGQRKKADTDVFETDAGGKWLLHGRAGGLGAMWIRYFAGAGDDCWVTDGVVLSESVCLWRVVLDDAYGGYCGHGFLGWAWRGSGMRHVKGSAALSASLGWGAPRLERAWG
jgi:hypothetical protein